MTQAAARSGRQIEIDKPFAARLEARARQPGVGCSSLGLDGDAGEPIGGSYFKEVHMDEWLLAGKKTEEEEEPLEEEEGEEDEDWDEDWDEEGEEDEDEDDDDDDEEEW